MRDRGCAPAIVCCCQSSWICRRNQICAFYGYVCRTCNHWRSIVKYSNDLCAGRTVSTYICCPVSTGNCKSVGTCHICCDISNMGYSSNTTAIVCRCNCCCIDCRNKACTLYRDVCRTSKHWCGIVKHCNDLSTCRTIATV